VALKPQPESPFKTVSEVAEYLRLSVSKIYEMKDSGEIGHYRIGGKIVISEEQLQRYLEATKQERGKVSATRQPPRPRLRHIKLA
jgi:excisionase family DNA binding protein